MDLFKRGDLGYIEVNGIFIQVRIIKKVMPYHGIVYDKSKTKYAVEKQGSDFRAFITESEIIPKIVFDREEKLKKLGI